MTQPLTFRGKLRLEDVLDMQHYRALAALRRPFRLLIGLVAVPVALLAVQDLYSHGLVSRNLYGLAPLSFLVLCCYAVGGWLLLQRSSVRSYYLKHPEHYLETAIALDDTGLSVRNAKAESRLAWSAIDHVINTPRGLYFFGLRSQSLVWLPLRAFDAPNSKSAVLNLLSQHAVRVTDAA
jgi:hypothetical protein